MLRHVMEGGAPKVQVFVPTEGVRRVRLLRVRLSTNPPQLETVRINQQELEAGMPPEVPGVYTSNWNIDTTVQADGTESVPTPLSCLLLPFVG
jgi:hypothetical protein